MMVLTLAAATQLYATYNMYPILLTPAVWYTFSARTKCPDKNQICPDIFMHTAWPIIVGICAELYCAELYCARHTVMC